MTDLTPASPPDPGFEYEFRLSQDPDDDRHQTIIRVSDDELKEIGWLVDTRDLTKHGWEERYLAALSITGQKVASADAAGVSVRMIDRRRNTDAIFDTLCQEALARRHAAIEDKMTEFALHGVPETYTNKRGETVTRRRHDPRLLLEVAKLLVPHLRPEDQKAAMLEGGITVRLQIGDGPPLTAGQLNRAPDVELEATEVTDDAV